MGKPVPGTGKGRWRGGKDTAELLELCVAAGATWSVGRSGHVDVLYGGRRCTIAATPSDKRTRQNERARLRHRLGLKI